MSSTCEYTFISHPRASASTQRSKGTTPHSNPKSLYDEAAASHYGEIRADLEKKGTPIGVNDLHIAGHARSQAHTLVSNNTKEFDRVEGLRLINWTKNQPATNQ